VILADLCGPFAPGAHVILGVPVSELLLLAALIGVGGLVTGFWRDFSASAAVRSLCPFSTKVRSARRSR